MISVIVPIYRVESYLEQCIRSIQNQTYKELEIILVDDGSDDGCPEICDRYGKMDSRIKVFHKKNGGLSDARNYGLKQAHGEFIIFVDSDDYIHPRLYEYMMNILNHYSEVDMVMCPFQKVEEHEERAYERISVNNGYRILEHREIMEEMFSEDYLNYTISCNKLYRKEMWEDMEFPVNRIHEDEFTSHELLYKAKKIGYLLQPSYYYRQRAGSIMTKVNPKECQDKRDAWKEKLSFFSDKESEAYAFCLVRSLTLMIQKYDDLCRRGEVGEAQKLRELFQKEWHKGKKKKLKGIPKERRAYFNSFAMFGKYGSIFMKFYWKNLSLKRKIRNKVTGCYYVRLGKFQAGKKWNPKIASIEDTLEKIIRDKSSVSRYGDGEYKWMAGIPQNSFQSSSKEMTKRLQEIIKSEEENHIVCLSDGFAKLDYLNREAQAFWYHFMGQHRKKWIAFLKQGKQYYNTNMTRPYMDYQDKTSCKHRFDLLKEIWHNRDVILIEGEKSRLGVGNDLFAGAKSIRRILAPAMNAYDKYDEILKTAMKQDKEALYLIALGPTATILAYDLYQSGRQAIDVGHVDIEYEWFLRGAEKKIRIPNKYVNEVNAGNGVGELPEDETYQSQIIVRIEPGE